MPQLSHRQRRKRGLAFDRPGKRSATANTQASPAIAATGPAPLLQQQAKTNACRSAAPAPSASDGDADARRACARDIQVAGAATGRAVRGAVDRRTGRGRPLRPGSESRASREASRGLTRQRPARRPRAFATADQRIAGTDRRQPDRITKSRQFQAATRCCRASCASVLMLLPSACATMASFSWSSGGIRRLNFPE